MCLIVHKPAGAKFDFSIIERASFTNSDGYGLMWIEDGKVNTFKSVDMSTLAESVDMMDDSLEIGLHLRWATHGTISKQNCHPFTTKGYALMHNGVIHGMDIRGKENDTRAFCRDYAWKHLKQYAEFEDAVKAIAADHGASNRMLIMSSTGNVARTGGWVERDGVFYSNQCGFPSTYGNIWPEEESVPYSLSSMRFWTYSQVEKYIRKNPRDAAALICDFLDEMNYATPKNKAEEDDIEDGRYF